MTSPYKIMTKAQRKALYTTIPNWHQFEQELKVCVKKSWVKTGM